MKPEDQMLTHKEVAGILNRIGHTRDHEFNCSECLQHVGEFAERQHAGHPLDDVIASVEHHLAMCPQCREEYLALMKILEATS